MNRNRKSRTVCSVFNFRASGNCVNTRPLICFHNKDTWHTRGPRGRAVHSGILCLPQLVSSVCIVYDTVTSDAVLV